MNYVKDITKLEIITASAEYKNLGLIDDYVASIFAILLELSHSS
jgi:hypothetical protein